MRLALTLAFLSSATLLAADAVVPVPGVPPSAAVSPAPALTLRQAVDRTLLYNLGLAVTRLDALRSLDAVEVSLATFDPTFAWNNRLSGQRTPAEILAGDPADRLHDSDLSLSQRFSWGG